MLQFHVWSPGGSIPHLWVWVLRSLPSAPNHFPSHWRCRRLEEEHFLSPLRGPFVPSQSAIVCQGPQFLLTLPVKHPQDSFLIQGGPASGLTFGPIPFRISLMFGPQT